MGKITPNSAKLYIKQEKKGGNIALAVELPDSSCKRNSKVSIYSREYYYMYIIISTLEYNYMYNDKYIQ